jgi:hypothetical protein
MDGVTAKYLTYPDEDAVGDHSGATVPEFHRLPRTITRLPRVPA